jgi:glutamate carboxypeptidase
MRTEMICAAGLLAISAVAAAAKQLPAQVETAIVRSVDAEAAAAAALLEKIVDINSGTFNIAGVTEVGKVLEGEFRALGFETRWISMDAVKRAPSLVAEYKGSSRKRVMLIGHMDTVFEPSSPFQKFERNGDIATAPGGSDMKGGLVVILSSLKALKSAGALDGANITVFLTGDEEAAGDPTEISRGEFVATAKKSDCVLSFEPLLSQGGNDFGTTARRGATRWDLHVTANSGHSSQIFSPAMGDGAIYEMSRIVSRFHDTLREANLTYSAGLALGGENIKVESNGDGSVTGKPNIVPGEARVTGDIRALFPDQLARVEEKMRAIVTHDNLPGTKAEISFHEAYPPMAPTAGNAKLLATLNEVNRSLGLREMAAADPMQRGAGDASFAAPYTDVLDGLGAPGTGAHAPGETVNVARLPEETKRVAVLIYRLTR